MMLLLLPHMSGSRPDDSDHGQGNEKTRLFDRVFIGSSTCEAPQTPVMALKTRVCDTDSSDSLTCQAPQTPVPGSLLEAIRCYIDLFSGESIVP